MNNKRVTIHLFCLLLFLGGCGVFWLFGGGEEQSESLNYIFDSRLECQTTEVGREQTSHNTSIHNYGDELGNSQLPPPTSKISSKETKKEQQVETVQNEKIEEEQEPHSEESISSKETEPSLNTISACKAIGFNRMAGKVNPVDGTFIKAALYEEQKSFSPASPVKIRLMDDVKVSGIDIPKNTIVYASANLLEGRVYLSTETITYKKKEYPFKTDIFDIDEKEGLKISDEKIALPAGYRLKMMRK